MSTEKAVSSLTQLEHRKQPKQIPTTVLVTNISPKATATTLSEFFSFCGNIQKISILKQLNAGEPGQAKITFETSAAAQTAVLLSNARVVDLPIQVTFFDETIETQNPEASEPQSIDVNKSADLFEPDAATASSGSDTTAVDENGSVISPQKIFVDVPDDAFVQQDFCVPEVERTKISVVASLIASGIVLGEDIINRAIEFDQQNNISSNVTARAQELDSQYHLSESWLALQNQALHFGNAAMAKIQEIDENYQISQIVSKAAHDTLNNPAVAAGVDSLFVAGAAVGGKVKQAFYSQVKQIEEALLQQHRERAAASASSSSNQQTPEETGIEMEEKTPGEPSAVLPQESVQPPSAQPGVNVQITPPEFQ